MTRAAHRLGLGTVQFGQAYGVSNTRGRVPVDDVAAILRRAAQAGVGTLDTAAGYGAAEDVLGGLTSLTEPFRVVTKTIALKNSLDAVAARARQSVTTLGRKPVDLLLVHSAGDLIGEGGNELWNALLELRDEGLFGGIGISAYVADDPVMLARKFRPAAMQIPFSLLDQRLIQTGALAALKDLGVEIHARSLFLQGLLFLSDDKLPPKLASAAGHLRKLRKTFQDAGTSPLAAALAFALERPEIDVAVVGVTTPAEFEEILTAAAIPAASLNWSSLALNDELVLTPSRW
ncbi:MAG TPA: aldo/keto reductase [Rhizomicrobium sp.]|jgi:aryl-alcohol dehydrogenase-like predicted oxidoreductase|nr:aldo/keto reductase [Rhizomicrobium sp.]